MLVKVEGEKNVQLFLWSAKFMFFLCMVVSPFTFVNLATVECYLLFMPVLGVCFTQVDDILEKKGEKLLFVVTAAATTVFLYFL